MLLLNGIVLKAIPLKIYNPSGNRIKYRFKVLYTAILAYLHFKPLPLQYELTKL